MKTFKFLLVALSASAAFDPAAAAPLAGPFGPDEHTLLLAHFDQGPHANHALGLAVAQGRGKVVPEGRFEGGLELTGGTNLVFRGAGNFAGDEGTVEFWIKPGWRGDDGVTRRVFGASGGPRNYLNINKLGNGRLGAGMCGAAGGGEEFTYRRADQEITSWKAGEWHHVAVCWAGGVLSLWLDGTLAGSREGALAPRVPPESINLGGSAVVLDELCISRVARYREEQPGAVAVRIAGQPVAPRMELAERWEFNEPAGVYRCAPVPAAASAGGLAILVKNYLDETDPANLPETAAAPRLELFAAPGEVEPAAFLMVADGAPLREVVVYPAPLAGPGGALPADRVTVRRVVRTPMRKVYTASRKDTEIVNRFLPRWQPLDIPAGELREVWLQFDVPGNAAPGVYEGAVAVRHAGGSREVPVRLEVLPIRLLEHPVKKLASYYRIGEHAMDPERVDRELRDMFDHGLRNLFPHFGLGYRMEGEQPVPDTADIEQGIASLRKAGFTSGSIVVESGLLSLARKLGHEDLGKDGDGASLEGGRAFLEAARRGMEAFVQVQRRHPEFRFYATHLDEVFGSAALLQQYIRLSRAARQLPQVPLYITFNTRDERADAFRKELDPFVDLRCNHGYTFEMWLARGHTMEEYERELEQSGDEAWFYHNARGTWWTPEWARLVNGLYLWASPFTTHCPWTYQAYQENPFDDTDGPETKGHDFGLSFPGNEDPADLVPTRCYEAMREGGDDLRYIATLEAAMAGATPAKAAEVQAARQCLERWRSLVRGWCATPPAKAGAPTERGTGAVDADAGWIMGKGVTGTARESPLIHDLASKHSGADWQRMRRELADWVLRLL